MPHHEIGKGALKMAIHLPKNNPRNVCWFVAGQLQILFLLLGILAGCAPSNVPQPANKVGGEKVVSTTSEGSSELASDEWAVFYMEQQPVGTIPGMTNWIISRRVNLLRDLVPKRQVTIQQFEQDHSNRKDIRANI